MSGSSTASEATYWASYDPNFNAQTFFCTFQWESHRLREKSGSMSLQTFSWVIRVAHWC
jgi:hypothetical protein